MSQPSMKTFQSTARRTVVLSTALFTMLALIMVVSHDPAEATQNVSPWNSHSHYISDFSAAGAYSMGVADANFDVAHCTPGSGDNRSAVKMAILDFGQPTRVSTSQPHYYGYGVRTTSNNSLISDDNVVIEAEQFSQGYLNAVHAANNTCVRLRVVMGINNSQMCNEPPNLPGENGCTRSLAGQTWGDAVSVFCSWLTNQGFGPYVDCGAGGDFETDPTTYKPSGNFVWDNYNATAQWEDGFHAHDASGALFYDYGDSTTRPNDWSAQNVYDIGYGRHTENYTIPEIYNPCTTSDWTGFNTFGQSCRPFSIEGVGGREFFPGELTECAGTETVPPGDWPHNDQCNSGNPYYYAEFGPRQAWDDLFAIQNHFYGLPSLDYATNI